MRYLTSKAEREFISRNAYGTALEIGGYDGGTTIELAQKCNMVFVADCFIDKGKDGISPDKESFIRNTQRHRNVILMQIDSSYLPTYFNHTAFDFIFIDGDHTKPAVINDTWNSTKILHPLGILALHDYGRYEGVNDACLWLQNIYNCTRLLETVIMFSHREINS